MRYSEIDLQCEDIMWFGVDKNGLIFECTSGGCGCVPEFVCCSKENTDLLYDFFTEELNASTQANLLIEHTGTPLADDSKLLSEKGVYCFDVSISDNNPNVYKKIAFPDSPILFNNLPAKIQQLLQNHFVDVDVSVSNNIEVKHAY